MDDLLKRIIDPDLDPSDREALALSIVSKYPDIDIFQWADDNLVNKIYLKWCLMDVIPEEECDESAPLLSWRVGEETFPSCEEVLDVFSVVDSVGEKEEIASFLPRFIEDALSRFKSIKFPVGGPVDTKGRCFDGNDHHISTCPCWDDQIKNKCEVCKRRIESFPFRIPHGDGGWEGMFCSPECASDDRSFSKEMITYLSFWCQTSPGPTE